MTNRKNKGLSRRVFLGGAAAAGFAATQGCSIVPSSVFGGPKHIAPSQKMNVAAIGCGGKGNSDIAGVAKTENIYALCEVDETAKGVQETFKAHPNAKRYKDFREMLDKEHKNLDAVIVSTPDHMHAPVAAMAMKMGLHVYCQKPLTHTVKEARALRDLARKHKVVTQMGNQGTALHGLRTAVEIIQSGGIGDVREVHVWTNRPIWPQGMGRPTEAQEIPSTLDWNSWLGVAPWREYNKAYCPFAWRGWQDFGTGSLGDMACHTANMAFMALKLGSPTSVVAENAPMNNETFPNWSIIKFEFPARGDMPPLTFTWYDKMKRPPIELLEGHEFSNSGSLLVGSKGKLYSPNDYGAKYHLLPEANYKDFVNPPETLPRAGDGSDQAHYNEWTTGCKGGPKPMSNFDYAGSLTETILLGNVAMKAGKKLEWDAEKMRFPNAPEADALLHKEYREGYEL